MEVYISLTNGDYFKARIDHLRSMSEVKHMFESYKSVSVKCNNGSIDKNVIIFTNHVSSIEEM